MKEYFILQYKMTNRKLKDFGLNPILGYLLILTSFLVLSIYLFHKTEFAQYAYILISLALTAKLSEIGRNDFLKLCFSDKHYKLVRVVENFAASLPFLIFLLYKQTLIGSVILVVVSLLLGLSSFKTSLNFTIPTPFYKKPFEFTVGFRNTFYIFPIAYILTFIAISVDNFNLGIFSLLLIFIVVIGFYPKPENEYFVWSFALTAKQFIIEKIKTALFYTTILCLPIVLTLCFFYFTNIVSLLAFYVFGCVFLMTIIFAKYAAYPNEMNIPEGIIIAIGVVFPPFLFVFAPYFYTKALKKLERFQI
jgi:hypothetical protein